MNTEQRHRLAKSRETDADEILAYLRHHGRATTAELVSRWPTSYRQRLGDLRKQGWVIACTRTPAGSVFVLQGHKSDGQLRMAV